MWIILLDRSSSMGDPFSGTGVFAGRSRTSSEKTKLAAAKAALREHLLGLGAPGRVALIAFNQMAEIVFTGMSNENAGVDAALEAIEARGGTDLAAALEQALVCVVEATGEMFFRSLVISDGLSDHDRAEGAAHRVATRGVIIDVILIDPTPKGEEVARTVALNGNVTAVTSEKGLGEQVIVAAAAKERQRAEIESVVAEHEAERDKLSVEVPVPDRLAFTAWHPAIVAAERWNNLAIFLHLAWLQAEVDQRIQELVSRILSRIASYDPWPAMAPKPIAVWRLISSAPTRLRS